MLNTLKIASRLRQARANFQSCEWSLLQTVLSNFAQALRHGPDSALFQTTVENQEPDGIRLTVVVPIYRDVETTRNCINSILRARNPELDQVLLINDASPDGPRMEAMLSGFNREPNLIILHNEKNIGFVKHPDFLSLR